MNDVLVGIIGASPVEAAKALRKAGCRMVSVIDDYVFTIDLGPKYRFHDGPLYIEIPNTSGDGTWVIVGL